MKRILLLIAVICSFHAAFATGTPTVNVTVAAGTTVVMSGSVQATFSGGTFVNNGSYTDTAGGFNVTANGMSFSGIGTTNLYNLGINSSAGTSLFSSAVTVNNTGTVTTGAVDANSELTLGTNGNLVNNGSLINGVMGLKTIASVTSGGCPSYTSLLSLNISGTVMKYQWSFSNDDIIYAPVAGATNATYTPTVTAPVYYRCDLTTTNTSYAQSTPGVLLNFSGTYPIITLGTNPTVGQGTTTASLPYTVTTGSPDHYSIFWTPPALTAGFANVVSASLTGSAITIAVPATAPVAMYSGTLYVTNGCTSIGYPFSVNVVNPIMFTSSSPQSLTVCENSGASTINSLLTVSDLAAGSTDTWSVVSGPSQGSLGGFDATASSGSASITPTGLTYTPTSGYSGADAFVIQISNGTATATMTVNVTVTPMPGNITGAASLCPGGTAQLTDLVTGGTWSSTNPSVGTVSTSGLVSGITQGTTTISYSVSNSCGSIATGKVVTVNTLPSATITNSLPMCTGGSVILYVTPAGGADTYFWQGPGSYFSALQNPTVYPGSTATYSLIVTNSGTGCSSPMYTTVVTVNPTPVAAPTNNGPACSGVSIILTANPGGGANAYSWSGPGGFNSTMQNPAVTPSVTSTYSLTVSSGSASGCTPTWLVYTTTVTVSAPVPVITGPTNICSGAVAALYDATTGGTWTSSNTAIATVGSATGILTGVSAGTAVITYLVSSGCIATTIVTINTTTAGSITGPSIVTVGSNIALTDPVGGGTWSASNGNASVSGGVVMGVTVGTVTISYSVTGTCGMASATKLVSVGAASVSVAAITGYYFYLCQNATAPFFDATAGGTWSINAADAAVASVSASGVVTGITAGTARLSYTVGAASATTTVTVYPVPAAIAGSGYVCIGQTTALTDASPGGAWTSGVPSYASVSAGGIVTGNIAGTVPIYYTLVAPAGCKTTFIITVNSNPAGITGPTSVCAGSSVQLTDVTSGGTWSSSSANITVDGSGDVTGVTAGSATVTYTVGGCARTYNVTVTGATAGVINGASSVTIGLNTTLTDAVAGGVWSASNSNATVSATGVVTGVAAGTVTISYTVSGGCGSVTATYVVTVNASGISGITGTTIVCIGTTTSLTDATPGGTWHSSSTSIATVGTSGVVTGVAAGTATISYIVAGSPVTIVVTVTSMPSGIGGATSVCNGSAITLSDFTAGGTWTSTAGVSVTNGTTVTTVTGLTDGTNTVTYSLGTGCFRTFAVTVKPVPTPILGNLNVCGLGAVTFLSDATAGISWAINPVGTATISPSGRVYGVSAGTATVTYTATNGCVTTAIATVNSAISVAAILGATNVSHGATITLSDATSGGAWSSSNSALGSVDGAGNVTGVGTSGTVTITYAVPYGSGCVAAATKTITVHTPAPHTVVTTTVGMTVSVSDEAMGGEWTSSDGSVAVVDANGTVTALAAGAATITHKSPTGSGEAAIQTTMVQVNDVALEVVILPNPNQGIFTVRGRVATDALITYQVTDMTGQIIQTIVSTARNGVINERIKLSNTLANGAYLLDIKTGNQHQVLHFIVAQ